MSTLSEIYWSHGDAKEAVSYVPGVDLQKNMRLPKKKRPAVKTKTSLQKITMTEKGLNRKASTAKIKDNNDISSSKSHRARLKDLCPEDKQRVANLIKELGKAGEEKEASEVKLGDERRHFAVQLETLKSEKERVEKEQQNLLTQYKECQGLLVLYQKQIAEQQKEVANDINRLLSSTPLSRSTNLDASRHSKLAHRDVTMVSAPHNNQSTPTNVPTQGTNLRDDVEPNLGESYMPSEVSPVNIAHKKTSSVRKTPKKTRSSSPRFIHTTDLSPCLGEYKESERYSHSDKVKSPNFKSPIKPSMHSKEWDGEVEQERNKKMDKLRRSACQRSLMQQKRALEVEQEHLQLLLEEQESLLRCRQKELKRRHQEYTERMLHFQRHGRFSSDVASYELFEDNKLPGGRLSRTLGSSDIENTLPESREVLDHVPHREDHIDAKYNRAKGFTSFDERVTGDDSTYRSSAKPAYTSEPETKTTYHSKSCRFNSSKDFQPSLLESILNSCDCDLKGNTLGLSLSRSYPDEYGRKLRNCLRGKTVDLTSTRYSTKSPKSTAITDDSDDQYKNRRYDDVSKSMYGFETTPLKKRSNAYDSSFEVGSRLQNTVEAPRRPLYTNNTMNNISDLSDLVAEVDERDVIYPPRLRQPSSVWSCRSIGELGDGMSKNSAIFDPEDSELLEDIFFIK